MILIICAETPAGGSRPPRKQCDELMKVLWIWRRPSLDTGGDWWGLEQGDAWCHEGPSGWTVEGRGRDPELRWWRCGGGSLSYHGYIKLNDWTLWQHTGDWLKVIMWGWDWIKRENELVEWSEHVKEEACTRLTELSLYFISITMFLKYNV